MNRILVAMDGPTGSGKSTCGRLAAKKLGLQFLDTGIFYRLFAWYLIEEKIELASLNNKQISQFDEKWFQVGAKKQDRLKKLDVEQLAKQVALNKSVRARVTSVCQKIIARDNYFLVGRDTTTVIASDAPIKIYLDVSAKEQIKRKAKVFASENKTLKEWKQVIAKTNALEKNRAHGPLRRVPDAHYIRNEHMTIEEVVNKIVKVVEKNKVQTFTTLLVGPTNAGKSTLFNALVERQAVITAAEMHTTRDWYEETVHWDNGDVRLVDSGGVKNDVESVWQKDIDERTKIWIDQAQFLVFVVDHQQSLGILQNSLFDYIKRNKKKWVLFVNKVERNFDQASREKWKKVPTKNIIFGSARRSKGVAELKQQIINEGQNTQVLPVKKATNEYKVLLAGRTNAGKSTLFNQIVGLNQSIVSNVENTTTNLVVREMICGNDHYLLYDSAGLRRKRNNKNTIEKAAEAQIKHHLQSMSVVVLVIDLAKELVEQDKKIIRLAKDEQIPLIIVANKIDLIDNLTVKKKQVRHFFSYIKEKELCFLSAAKRNGINSFWKKMTKICKKNKKLKNLLV